MRTGNYNIVNLEILDFLMHCEAKRTFLMPITQINEIFWKSRNILSHTIFQSQFKNVEATLGFLLALYLSLPPPNVSFVVSFQKLISVSSTVNKFTNDGWRAKFTWIELERVIISHHLQKTWNPWITIFLILRDFVRKTC